MSIIRGCLIRWLLFPTPFIIYLPLYLKIITLITCIFGGLFGYLISKTSFYFYNKSLNNNKLVIFFSLIGFIPFISSTKIVKLPLIYRKRTNIIDFGWNE
jgi:hypothetical protein